jgi:hypothetical protein
MVLAFDRILQALTLPRKVGTSSRCGATPTADSNGGRPWVVPIPRFYRNWEIVFWPNSGKPHLSK